MSPTIYSELNHVLLEFRARLSELLHDALVGIYLQGSLAIGDFDQADSDIDFLVVIARDLTTDQVDAVRRLHAAMTEFPSRFADRLEGSYFPRELLKNSANVGRAPLWFFNNGTKRLSQETYDNTWVVLWVMRHYGITVFGPHHRELSARFQLERCMQKSKRRYSLLEKACFQERKSGMFGINHSPF